MAGRFGGREHGGHFLIVKQSKTVSAGFSPEIQALRALAVMSVVVFHFWPLRITGGYVGVDVFFVISGFLITGQLVREYQRSGTLDLVRFWARRIRRLFPAALLVLLVTLGVAVALLPVQRWQQVVTQFWACLALIQNWVLGYSAINYFNADTNVSPLQHYWSLSVEEQFYLVWPVLLLVVVIVTRRFGKGRALRAFVVAAVVIGIASFVWSIIETEASQSFAYFSTLTHVWEFVAGGILAVAATRVRTIIQSNRLLRHPVVLGLALVGGALLIVASDFHFTASTLFPGWIAIIPVIGTLAVLVVSIVGAPGVLHKIVSFRPITWTGDISYSLYLWHWPIIVFAPVIFGKLIPLRVSLPLLALAFALAWLTKILVEDPIRLGKLARVRPLYSYAVGAALVILSVVISLVPYQNFQGQVATAAALSQKLETQSLDVNANCFGANAVLNAPAGGCPESHQISAAQSHVSQWLEFIPPPSNGDWAATWSGCPTANSAKLAPCYFGPSDAKFNVAVVGDSHGFQWANAILPLAQKNKWRLSINWFAGCGILEPGPDIGHIGDGEDSPTCVAWEKAALNHVVSDPKINVVVMSAFTQKFTHGGAPIMSGIQQGYKDAFTRILDAGKQVIVVADTPLPQKNVPECLAASNVKDDPCTTPLSFALNDDPMVDAAKAIHNPSIHVVDLHSVFCDTICHSVVGGIPAYKDGHHLTTPFLETLTPVFEPLLDKMVRTQ
jgi:peptidoglycan/LPS O-acetylase OafA/YrhL